MRSDRERVLDILDAIEKIKKYVKLGRKAFDKDELVQSWIVRHLEIIGEAARGISPGVMKKHPEVSWPGMIGMRNVIAHGYFEVDEADGEDIEGAEGLERLKTLPLPFPLSRGEGNSKSAV